MRVLVLGGTGTLGRQIAKQALDAGHTVRCMVRAPRKASFLQEWGCELTRGNLLDPDSLAYALEDQEAVIDAATARATDSESVYRIDWDGKLNLYNQCRLKGVRRVVRFAISSPRFVYVDRCVAVGSQSGKCRLWSLRAWV